MRHLRLTLRSDLLTHARIIRADDPKAIPGSPGWVLLELTYHSVDRCVVDGIHLQVRFIATTMIRSPCTYVRYSFNPMMREVAVCYIRDEPVASARDYPFCHGSALRGPVMVPNKL